MAYLGVMSPRSNPRLALLCYATIATLVLFLTGSISPATHQSSQTQFSAEEFIEPIKYLASDQLQGRGDGTPQLDEAANYLAKHFRKVGLKPAGDDGTFLQHFTLVVGAKLGEHNFVIALFCRAPPRRDPPVKNNRFHALTHDECYGDSTVTGFGVEHQLALPIQLIFSGARRRIVQTITAVSYSVLAYFRIEDVGVGGWSG